ncbi:hypothetical protein SCATT_11290 [Streptantibioticus cattleyicolor NRRL 8057 = DSM 46488]|uniref:Uncharacterized protein n=1 Tax=Streptantibioticus cattleyicolor (strain ATCC 35852 / DSM 46488 / JCM 4925 / NBRC 14057 / NRRL 8057) TaxID=1003195 RepID=G8WQ00_STREN|nr:hypothetical protein SCATT_11290 [Streptantibioticus cattleyicolor NRRL 8057 = DSM 46488]
MDLLAVDRGAGHRVDPEHAPGGVPALHPGGPDDGRGDPQRELPGHRHPGPRDGLLEVVDRQPVEGAGAAVVDRGGGAGLRVEVVVVALLGQEGPLVLDTRAAYRVAVHVLPRGVHRGLGVGVEDVAFGDLGDHPAARVGHVRQAVPDHHVASGLPQDPAGRGHVAAERLHDADLRHGDGLHPGVVEQGGVPRLQDHHLVLAGRDAGQPGEGVPAQQR